MTEPYALYEATATWRPRDGDESSIPSSASTYHEIRLVRVGGKTLGKAAAPPLHMPEVHSMRVRAVELSCCSQCIVCHSSGAPGVLL